MQENNFRTAHFIGFIFMKNQILMKIRLIDKGNSSYIFHVLLLPIFLIARMRFISDKYKACHFIS